MVHGSPSEGETVPRQGEHRAPAFREPAASALGQEQARKQLCSTPLRDVFLCRGLSCFLVGGIDRQMTGGDRQDAPIAPSECPCAQPGMSGPRGWGSSGQRGWDQPRGPRNPWSSLRKRGVAQTTARMQTDGLWPATHLTCFCRRVHGHLPGVVVQRL